MHDSHTGHVFTDEFDDLCVLISLDMDSACAGMNVTLSEPDCVWNERVPVSSEHHTTRTLDKG